MYSLHGALGESLNPAVSASSTPSTQQKIFLDPRQLGTAPSPSVRRILRRRVLLLPPQHHHPRRILVPRWPRTTAAQGASRRTPGLEARRVSAFREWEEVRIYADCMTGSSSSLRAPWPQHASQRPYSAHSCAASSSCAENSVAIQASGTFQT